MSLRPNVTPFVPRQKSTASSNQGNVSQSSLLKLSAEVAEFVPSWLNNRSTLSQGRAQTPSDAKATKHSRKKRPGTAETIKQVVEKSKSNSTPSNGTPKPSSFTKTTNVTNSSKKNAFEQEPDYHNTKETARTRLKNDEINIESDFPALGSSVEQDKTAVWSKPVAFGVSFSDKLKTSKSDKTSNYSYNEPPRPFYDKTEKQKTTSKKSKEPIRYEDKLEEIKIDNIVNEKLADNIAKSEDEGFYVVRNRSKKTRESYDKEDNFSGQDERRVAWSEVRSHERTNEVTKPGKKSSENRNKIPRERVGPVRDTYSVVRDTHGAARDPYGIDHLQKNGRSTSADWRSGKNVTDHKNETTRELRKDKDSTSKNEKSTKTRHSFQDYYSLKPTHGASDSESNYDRNKEEKSSERLEDNKSSPRGNVFVNVSTSQARPPMSYSDILKSKPNIQLPDPRKVDGSERGVLKMPSGASGEEELDGQEVEEGEGKSIKKKKKKKKKKKSTTEGQPQAVKKSKEALTLDVGDMLMKYMESSSTKKKAVIRTGGFLPAQAPLPPKETRIAKKSEPQASNVLDSTAPIVFRSKEREFPKKKKPSAMRKILMKEREEKKMTREGKSANEQSSDDEKPDHESSDEQNLDSDDIDQAEVKKSIHSRKFREYCDQDLGYDINGVVITLLKELIRFQDRLYHKDPIKAKARRRFVCGLREVHKHAKLKKLKCVIVTPNLEPTKSKGGLDDLLSNIIDVCHSQNVPVIFSLNRQVLGKVLLKKVPVSIVGIFYYDGAQNYFKTLMTLTEVARETYKDKFNQAREKFLLEKQMAKELALIEAGLHSTEIQKEIDQIIMYNDVKNVQANVETKNELQDCRDEKREMSLRNIEDNVNIENVTPDVLAGGSNTAEVNIETTPTNENSCGNDKRETFLTNNEGNLTMKNASDGLNAAGISIKTTPTNENSCENDKRETFLTNNELGNLTIKDASDGLNAAGISIKTPPTTEDSFENDHDCC